MIYGSWNIRCNGQKFLLFWAIFCLSAPWQPGKSKHWKKHLEILPFYTFSPQMTVIWYMVPEIWHVTKTKNYDQMMCTSWDMVCDGSNCYFSFWVIFCSFTPLTARKIKILKKWKKHLDISSFYICVPKTMIRWCMVPEIQCVTDVIIFHFGPFFALLPT